MHIFLTGDIQVGKSTVIRKFLSMSGLSADGFMTYWEQDGANARSLYLSSYSPGTPAVEKYLVARNTGKDFLPANVVDVFDVKGAAILEGSGKTDVIVMDELGFLESKAIVFHEAVMRRISGSVPVIGVIKPVRTDWLDTIRAHPGVEVHIVTIENRDDVLKELLDHQTGRCA